MAKFLATELKQTATALSNTGRTLTNAEPGIIGRAGASRAFAAAFPGLQDTLVGEFACVALSGDGAQFSGFAYVAHAHLAFYATPATPAGTCVRVLLPWRAVLALLCDPNARECRAYTSDGVVHTLVGFQPGDWPQFAPLAAGRWELWRAGGPQQVVVAGAGSGDAMGLGTGVQTEIFSSGASRTPWT